MTSRALNAQVPTQQVNVKLQHQNVQTAYIVTTSMTRYNINHEATDYDRCTVFKIRVRKFIESTDYSVKPIISEVGKVDSYINKVDNYINKPMIARHVGLSVASLNSLNNTITDPYLK